MEKYNVFGIRWRSSFSKGFQQKIFLRLQKKLNCYGIKGKENYKNKSYMGFFFFQNPKEKQLKQ